MIEERKFDLTSGKIVDKMRNITWYNDIVD